MDWVIRREIIVARSGGFSEMVLARSGNWRDLADLEETGEYESGFHAKNLFFSVERVEFEMAVLKQRKIDGGRRVF